MTGTRADESPSPTPTAPEDQMLRVYADFNDPASFILQQRLMLGRHDFTWCAVEGRPGIPVEGRPISDDEAVTADASRAETRPNEIPPVLSLRAVNTRAATAAYAESVSDGKEADLRTALLAAIHLRGRDISHAEDVRRIVAAVMLPDLTLSDVVLRSRQWISLGAHEPDQLVRLLGGTVTRTGGPLTSAGQSRLSRWRREWQILGSPPLPALAGPSGLLLSGLAVLRSAIPSPTPPTSAPVPLPRSGHEPTAQVPAGRLALVGRQEAAACP